MIRRATELTLVLLAVLTAWSIAGMQLASAALLLLFLASRGWARATEVRGATLAFCGVCIASVVLSPALIGSYDASSWRPALLVWLVAACASTLEEREMDRVGAAWIAAMALSAAWGIFQTFTGQDLLALLHLRKAAIVVPSPWEGHFSALGFFNSRLTFANGLLVPLGMAGAFGLLGRGRARAVALAAAAVLTVGLLFSFTRAAWWGALLAAAILLARTRARAGVVVLAIAIAAAFAVPTVRHRLTSSVSVASNEDRVFIWARAREVISDHPVLGVGFGAYPKIAQPYYDRVDPDFPMHTWAHDTPLSLLAETGPAGLCTYLWLWLCVYVVGWRAVRSGSVLALGLFAGTLGVHVAGLFHDVLYDGEVAHALYLGAGMLAGLGLRPRRGTADQPTAERGASTTAGDGATSRFETARPASMKGSSSSL